MEVSIHGYIFTEGGFVSEKKSTCIRIWFWVNSLEETFRDTHPINS